MSNDNLATKRIAILATNGFEQSELFEPLNQLKDKGATVDVISPESGEIKGWNDNNWGKSVSVDKALSDADCSDYDALVLPGGVINPDLLRNTPAAIDFIRDFYHGQTNAPVAAVCHGPWLLVEAGLVKDAKVTSFPSIKTDLVNAGAHWVDEQVVIDKRMITSRNPDDLPHFIQAIADSIQ